MRIEVFHNITFYGPDATRSEESIARLLDGKYQPGDGLVHVATLDCPEPDVPGAREWVWFALNLAHEYESNRYPIRQAREQAIKYREAKNRSFSAGDVIRLENGQCWSPERIGWAQVEVTDDQIVPACIRGTTALGMNPLEVN